MNKLIFLLKFYQVLANSFMIIICVLTIWKLFTIPATVMSSEQMRAWMSQSSKTEVEQYIVGCDKAQAGLEHALLLLAKWVLCISAFNLILIIVEYWIVSRRSVNASTKLT